MNSVPFIGELERASLRWARQGHTAGIQQHLASKGRRLFNCRTAQCLKDAVERARHARSQEAVAITTGSGTLPWRGQKINVIWLSASMMNSCSIYRPDPTAP